MINSYETSTLQKLTYEGDIVASYMFVWTEESKNVGIVHIGSQGDVTGHKTLSREMAKSMFLSLRKDGASKVLSRDYVPAYYQTTIQWLLERI